MIMGGRVGTHLTWITLFGEVILLPLLGGILIHLNDLMTLPTKVPLSFFENLATVNSGQRRLDDLDLDWGPQLRKNYPPEWSWEAAEIVLLFPKVGCVSTRWAPTNYK